MNSIPDSLPSFGRYEPLFRVAAGGMAEVFAARIRGEAGFEKFVAVKRMLPHLAEDEHFVGMFLDEARLAVHVASPHVVQTLDLGRADDGALYIAMELVVGCSLASLARELRGSGGRVPLPIALEILAQAAQGLDDAHEATTPTGVPLDIVHRDVSPHNLLIGVDGRTRVSDFGIARAMLRRTSTATGELKGKFAYFSPEQAEGQAVDRRSDIFALGIVAWETLLGRRLFGGNDMLQVLAMVRSQEIPSVDEIDPAIPPAVSQVVARALARNMDERYATAHEFSVALREAARSVGPAPSAREIGKWVAQTAPASVARIRDQLDSAHASDDAATVARDISNSYRKGAPASSPGTPAPAATAPPSIPPTTNPSTLAASTLPSSFPEPTPGKGSRTALVGVTVAVAAVGVFLGARQLASSESKPAAAPVESVSAAPTASTSAPPPASAAPAASAEPSTSKSTRGRPPPTPTGRTTAPAATAPAATTPAGTATTPPAATAAPHPTAEKKGPTGPLLGDDAFK